MTRITNVMGPVELAMVLLVLFWVAIIYLLVRLYRSFKRRQARRRAQ